VALPGDGKPLPTVLKRFASEGKGTGLVTTSFLTDATPAAFAAHADARSQQKDIAAEMLRQRPNVLLGGGAKGIPLADDAKAAGYEVVTDRAGLHAVKAAAGGHTLGLFGVGPMCYEYAYLSKTKTDYDQIPHLSEMATEALRLLAAEPKGFFLMIEGGCIDKACHSNDLPRAIHETIEFDKTVRLAAEWAAKRGDTLLLVTADHETGGLKVVAGKGKGQLPEVTWESKKHSGANVPLLAPSSGPAAVKGTLDNTDIFRLMTGTLVSPTVYKPPVGVMPPPEPAAAAKDD
jgi:alkaline phosphatase